MRSIFRRAGRSCLLPGAVLAIFATCGCTTSWMWLDIENETDGPIRANLSGKECVMRLDLGPGQSARLEGYDLGGDVVAGSKVFKLDGMRSGSSTWKFTGRGGQTEARLEHR